MVDQHIREKLLPTGMIPNFIHYHSLAKRNLIHHSSAHAHIDHLVFITNSGQMDRVGCRDARIQFSNATDDKQGICRSVHWNTSGTRILLEAKRINKGTGFLAKRCNDDLQGENKTNSVTLDYNILQPAEARLIAKNYFRILKYHESEIPQRVYMHAHFIFI